MRPLLADSARSRTSASNIEIRSQTDSCSRRPRVNLERAPDDNSQRGTRRRPGHPRDQDLARARHSGWSWLTPSQPGGKVERVMGIEPT